MPRSPRWSTRPRRYPVAAWKTFTHFPDAFEGDGNGWWLDDRDPNERQVGERFIRKAKEIGTDTICVHKGLSLGSPFRLARRRGPGGAQAPRHELRGYHSGFEANVARALHEGHGHGHEPTDLVDGTRGDRPERERLRRDGHVVVVRDALPDQAAHFLGKLLRYIGEDNVLWGTDCLFYGSPQPMIQAMRAFQISAEFQERYGYPKLTKELKAKILGPQRRRLYGVEPNTETCEFSRRDLEQIRRKLPGLNRVLGPTTMAETQAFRDDDREQWATMATMLA